MESILAGDKKVELRRLRPKIDSGPALIYATSPRMCLVASFEIKSVRRAPLDLLWQLVGDRACVTRQEFDCYFDGLESGVSIEIAAVRSFQKPVSLHQLRVVIPGFQPPQGFRYLEQSIVAELNRTAGRNSLLKVA